MASENSPAIAFRRALLSLPLAFAMYEEIVEYKWHFFGLGGPYCIFVKKHRITR